jgi:putative thiamine transport system ATP-binding protein
VSLVLKTINLTLGDRTLIQAFNLDIAPGEIVMLMGPSGSGKTSLLSAIAGDLAPPLLATGDIILDGQRMNAVAPERRQIGRLFQDDLLFPHFSVGENILFGMARGNHQERLALMNLALERAELAGFADRAPQSLSGGQRARVALMRALMAKPKAMLLDEPFNKLDKSLRESFRAYVFQHLSARQVPTLMVSHDIADAPEGGRVFEISAEGKLNRV